MRFNFDTNTNMADWKPVHDSKKVNANNKVYNQGEWKRVMVNGNGLYQQSNVVYDRKGKAYQGSFRKGSFVYLNTLMNKSDYEFKVDIKPVPDGGLRNVSDGRDAGVMFRYKDSENYYRLSLNAYNSYMRLEKKVAGTFYSLGTNAIGYKENKTYSVKVEAIGNKIHVSVNGERIFGVVDGSLPRGSVALYAQDKARFDNVAITRPPTNTIVTLVYPLSNTVLTKNNIKAKAVVSNVPPAANVIFKVNQTLCNKSNKLALGVYVADCSPKAQGDYQVSVLVTAKNVNKSDKNVNVGVQGDYYLTMGDSITAGNHDNYVVDNVSTDNRIAGKRGYQALLNNYLSVAYSKPHSVVNEGIGGDTSADAADIRVNSVLDRHPRANKVLIMYGTNDANRKIDPEVYGNKMRKLIDKIARSSNNKQIYAARVPPIFTPEGVPVESKNSLIRRYNNKLAGAGAQLGPDYYN